MRFTLECPECGQTVPNHKEYHGHRFVKHVREIVETVTHEYTEAERMPGGVAFHMLVLLDGMGESCFRDEYRVQVKSDCGWEDIEFCHHDLYKE